MGVASLYASSLAARPVRVSSLGVWVSAALTRKLRNRPEELLAADVGLLRDHSAALTCIRAEASSDLQMSTLILAASSFHFSSSSISMAS